jgi:hypothetical protein
LLISFESPALPEEVFPQKHEREKAPVVGVRFSRSSLSLFSFGQNSLNTSVHCHRGAQPS